jgi:hypothetical protein
MCVFPSQHQQTTNNNKLQIATKPLLTRPMRAFFGQQQQQQQPKCMR